MPPVPHSPAAEAQAHAALIVALDAGDLAGADLVAAEALAVACDGCCALAADLVAIRGAMAALPVVPRRRDYRLTAEDAARLRPSGWRRLLEWLAAPGSTVRPLATGLATLGVVGLLLTSGLPGLLPGFGGAASSPVMAPAGPVDDAAAGGTGPTELQGSYAPAAAPSAAPANVAAPAPTAAPAPLATGAFTAPLSTDAGTSERTGAAGEAATAEPMVGAAPPGSSDGAGEAGKALGRGTTSALPLPALASLALLAAGLALLAGRMLARRRLS